MNKISDYNNAINADDYITSADDNITNTINGIKNEFNTDGQAYITDINIKKILNGNSRTYFDILLYNCYDKLTNTIDLEKFNNAMEDIVAVYEKLFDFSLSFAGFQFIGLFLQNEQSGTISFSLEISYFLLSLGFMFSMFGVFLSFIVIEYIKGFRDEDLEFKIAGLTKYKNYFKLTDMIIYVNCILFIVPLNVLIYKNIGYIYGVIYNIMCSILFIFGMYRHYETIIKKQEYKIGNIIYKRKINKNK